jgi:hypothetical protein
MPVIMVFVVINSKDEVFSNFLLATKPQRLKEKHPSRLGAFAAKKPFTKGTTRDAVETE